MAPKRARWSLESSQFESVTIPINLLVLGRLRFGLSGLVLGGDNGFGEKILNVNLKFKLTFILKNLARF